MQNSITNEQLRKFTTRLADLGMTLESVDYPFAEGGRLLRVYDYDGLMVLDDCDCERFRYFMAGVQAADAANDWLRAEPV